MAKVFTTVQTIGAGLTYDVQPPVGQDWKVSDIASSAIVGVAPAGVPNATAGLFDGVNGPALFRNSSAANPHVRGWSNPAEWYINNTNYLRVTNPEVGGLNIAISIALARDYGPNGASAVISDLGVLIAGATLTIQPPIGQDWLITDIGSTRWVGAQPAGLPNVIVSLTDGTNAAVVIQGTDARGWEKPLNLHINNTTFLTINNPVGAGATVGYSGIIARDVGPNGQSEVVSFTAVLGAGAVGNVRPPVGEEWLVDDIGCSVWVGVAPAGLPSILVSVTDGTIAAIAQQGTDTKGWLGKMQYYINRNNWLTLTDAGAGSNVAVSAIRWRE